MQPELKKKEAINLTYFTEVYSRKTGRHTHTYIHTLKNERKGDKEKYSSTHRNHRKSCDYTEISLPFLHTIYILIADIYWGLMTILGITSTLKAETQQFISYLPKTACAESKRYDVQSLCKTDHFGKGRVISYFFQGILLEEEPLFPVCLWFFLFVCFLWKKTLSKLKLFRINVGF